MPAWHGRERGGHMDERAGVAGRVWPPVRYRGKPVKKIMCYLVGSNFPVNGSCCHIIIVNHIWLVLVVIKSQRDLIRCCVKTIPPTTQSYAIPLARDSHFREVVHLSQTNQVNNHHILDSAVN